MFLTTTLFPLPYAQGKSREYNIYLSGLKQWELKVRLDVISQNPNDFFRKLALAVCCSIYALDFLAALYQCDTAEVNHYLVTVYSTWMEAAGVTVWK